MLAGFCGLTHVLLCLWVPVEAGVRLGLEGAHRQVLSAGGIHIRLPGDGRHGRLVSLRTPKGNVLQFLLNSSKNFF